MLIRPTGQQEAKALSSFSANKKSLHPDPGGVAAGQGARGRWTLFS